ncbi:hypothetical protein MRX96_056841 [Rhipicephalus microplus]
MDSQLNIKAPKKKTVGTLDDILVSAMNVIQENAAENVPSSQVEDLIQDLTLARQASHEYVKKLKASLEDMHRDNYLLRKEISKLQIRLSMLREARKCRQPPCMYTSLHPFIIPPTGGYEEEILVETARFGINGHLPDSRKWRVTVELAFVDSPSRRTS